jgi:hypothetical protein
MKSLGALKASDGMIATVNGRRWMRLRMISIFLPATVSHVPVEEPSTADDVGRTRNES